MQKRRKTMSMQRGALNSASSGEPSQPWMPCSDPSNQERNVSGRNFLQSSCLTREDVQREVREVAELVISQLANNFQSSMENAFKEMAQQMSSLKNDVQKLMETVELAINHSPHLGRECRANAKSTGENEVRNLQLQVQTKVSDTLFTGKKVEGEGGARISVALIDANTGDVVRSDKESFIRLDVVVLKGGFNKDDGDNWTKEEFDSQLVKVREKKGLLLTGDLQLTLKGGVGELGELIFRDNSRSDDTEKFRIGLKVASGYCENTRIREGKTNAFRVKERRGESNQKHYPPALDDEVWRLDKIAKGGISHQKLERAGIHEVQDFLQHLHNDSKKLREVLGKSITSTHWECLVDHAKTCTNWKTYENHSNNMSKHAAVFNTDRQLTGLINDILYSATDRLSAQEKEPGDAIIKKAAFDNWNDVGEFHCEIFSGSMPKNSSQVIEGQIGNLIPVQCHSAPRTCATSVGPEAQPANAGSPVEVLSPGHNDVADLPLPVQSQITGCGDAMEFPVDESAPPAASQHLSANRQNAQFSQGDGGSTCFGQPIQSPDIISQEASGSQMSNPWRQTDSTPVEEVALPSEPPYAPRPEGDHAMEDSQFDDADHPMDYLSILDFSTTFQTSPGDDGSV